MAGRRGAERADRDAPGEFLAEFLSAIMRRQYAEALKYCRLILQYEPHNATARGFFPLLQHKIRMHEAEAVEGGASPRRECSRQPHRAHQTAGDVQEEFPEQEESVSSRSRSVSAGSADSAGSVGSSSSQSSLELDSSSAPAESSRSLSPSRRTDLTDSASGASGASVVSDASVVSGGWSGPGGSSASPLSTHSTERWPGTNDPAAESITDDNGNAPLPPAAVRAHEDARNDNTTGGAPGAASAASATQYKKKNKMTAARTYQPPPLRARNTSTSR